MEASIPPIYPIKRKDVERLEKLLYNSFRKNIRNEILCDTDVLVTGNKVTKSYRPIPKQLER